MIMGCWGIGAMLSLKLYKRYKSLETTIAFLKALSTDVRYLSEEYSMVLARLAGRSEFERLLFLKVFSDKTTDGISFPLLLEQSIGGTAGEQGFREEDKEILLSLSSTLGISDREGQLATIEYHARLLETNRQSALEEYRKKGALYQKLALLTGIAAALVIL